MRLRVFHETCYIYSEPIHALAMEARLQPGNDDYQFCHRYRLSVTPKTNIETYTTFNELAVHYWTLLKASEVTVTSESIVDIRPRPTEPVSVRPQPIDLISMYPFVTPTQLTGITPDIVAFAEKFRRIAMEDWFQAVIAVQGAIHDLISYSVGSTATTTTATEVLHFRYGVCQDYTHLMLAVLRCLEIPARYVSGYLNQEFIHQPSNAESILAHASGQEPELNFIPDARMPFGEIAVVGSGASHAWVEVYLGPTIGWRGFDPTNNLFVDHNFVRIGSGRDFTDITPVKGVHKGPADEHLTITVSVTRQQS